MIYPVDFYEPHNGVHPGMIPPPNLEWRYPDADVPLTVYLAVHAYPKPSQPSPRDRRWALLWEQGVALTSARTAAASAPNDSDNDSDSDIAEDGAAGTTPAQRMVTVPVARVLEATREPDRAHHTFWGPVTRAVPSADLAGARLVPVATLDSAARRALEKLAGRVRVMKPNGWWNGQNWIVQLLRSAADEDIITAGERDAAIYTAAAP
ncbi:hypothetical protein FA95DRAFT_1116289 [Auriscalpium vulgare]|uniref:Uncharacterized protein n=1 Tax=Auriscalpium vulgare TaxID=40419 RepID=A0ACB8RW04_9AGAM|nr:hypothetical protein FA95DRAFT_1116289 [Auriscalpium vulgare]